jgi:hypothetical protein
VAAAIHGAKVAVRIAPEVLPVRAAFAVAPGDAADVRAPVASTDAAAGAAAAAPHSLQNRAPASSRFPQVRQLGAASDVPHSLQNFPVARAPHEGHDVGALFDAVMTIRCADRGALYTHRRACRVADRAHIAASKPCVHAGFMPWRDHASRRQAEP